MKVLSGAYVPDEGAMFLDGKPYLPRDPQQARHAGVAMIYQELSLAPHLSVMENIVLGMEPTRRGRVDWTAVRRIASEALAAVGRSDIQPGTTAGELSIADQQLVEIARAVAVGCNVLVLDEPTSSLAKRDVDALFGLIRRLKAQGKAVLFISHVLEEVKAVSDQFVVLRDGRSVGGGVTAETPADRIVELMTGRKVDDLYPRSPRSPGEVVLSLESLAGQGKPSFASLEVRRGEVVGIAGVVGAGRTELLEAVFGLRPVVSGTLRVAAFEGPATPRQRWAQGTGMLSEDRKREGLALSLSIADNLTLSALPPVVRPACQAAATREWAGRMELRYRDPWQAVHELSGGNQQKVAFARLLHHEVDLLLLDEPTRGIDVGAKALIYALIDGLAVAGKAVLMVSSYLPELLGTCDRIAVMHRGRLGRARPVAEWTEHAILLEATGGGETHAE
jgi:ribose transport system ATP-binding protein